MTTKIIRLGVGTQSERLGLIARLTMEESDESEESNNLVQEIRNRENPIKGIMASSNPDCVRPDIPVRSTLNRY